MRSFSEPRQRELEEVLRRLSEDQHDRWGGEVRSVHPLSRIRRPFSEVTILEVELESSKRKIVVKQFTLKNDSPEQLAKMQARVRKEFDVTRLFHDKFRDCSGFSTAEPIGCYPDLLSIAMTYSPGENLADVVDKMARYSPGKATLERLSAGSRACGRYLVGLQKMTAETGRLDLAELIEDIDLRLKAIVKLESRVMDSRLRGEILDHCGRQASLATDSDLRVCGVHGDYCTSNILVAGDEVTVLDFTMFKPGSTFHDVTYFCRNLTNFLHKPIFRPQTFTILQRAFLDGYDENLDPTGPVFKLLSLRHVVCHLAGLVKASVPLHVRLFNKRVARRHAIWIRNALADSHPHALA